MEKAQALVGELQEKVGEVAQIMQKLLSDSAARQVAFEIMESMVSEKHIYGRLMTCCRLNLLVERVAKSCEFPGKDKTVH